ncbi:MAG: DUF6167 family protein [Nocardioidaceae bacterium]
MNRLTWFAAGAATGVYGIVRGRRAARNLTPDGLAARAAAFGAGLRVFTAEVSAGMAEREGAALTDPAGGANVVPVMIGPAAHPRDIPAQSRSEPGPDGHR